MGYMLIAGGAIRASANQIFGAFVAKAGGTRSNFVLLPSATAKPESAMCEFKEFLGAVGVDPTRISCLEVSPVIPGWEQGAENPRVLELVAAADGIWLSGGNQNHTMRALLHNDGSDSALAALLRRKLADGAVLGGTSAGAAVLSDPMIGGGTSLGALGQAMADSEGGTEISDALFLSRGLGLFPHGLVDQHFDARARLGRLLVAALAERRPRPAFGVAEDTAMLWDSTAGTVSALGAGGVYVLETAGARMLRDSDRVRSLDGVSLHYLTEGDSYRLADKVCVFCQKKQLAAADAYFSVSGPESSGCFSAYGRLAEFISCYVLDNAPEGLFRDDDDLPYGRSYLWEPGPARGKRSGWELRFVRRPESELWYGNRYGFSHVELRIRSVLSNISDY